MDPLPAYRVAAPVVAVALLAVFCAVRPILRARAALLGVGLMSGYAAVQDQVSARLCPEYFTVLHPPVPGLTDPTLTGIVWGFLGSWWGGALAGYAAGIAATVGGRPPLGLRDVTRGLAGLVAVVAAVTALTGFVAARHAELFGATFQSDLAAAVPPERRTAAFVVACYHMAAYVTAAVGSVAVCVWLGSKRPAFA